MKLPEEIRFIFDRLNSNGHEAFIVGGCVRDITMGKTPHDYDITTSARVDETIRAFSDHHVIETGIKHGTVTVIINKKPFEITTYRIDGKYTDNRRPDTVCFTTSLEEDLKRRDFTINAMAYNEKRGLVDLFGGEKDIENKTIRCVGIPDERFNEDALRILRALRFSSVLGFEIEKETALSLKRNRALLKNISVERIYSELINTLLGAPDDILCDFKEVFEIFLPDISTGKNINRAKKDKIVRLALLLENVDLSEFKKLKPDNKTYYGVKEILSFFEELVYDKFDLRLKIGKLKYTSADMLTDFCENSMNYSGYFEFLTEEIGKIISDNECISLKQLAVNGSDIISAANIEASETGKYLDDILKKVIKKELPNERDEIIKYIRK